MPKELTLQQFERNRSATQRYERMSTPRAAVVNRLRDQLLAGAALSLNKNGGLCRRDKCDLFEHRSQRRTFAFDLPTPVVDHPGQAAAEFASDGRDSSDAVSSISKDPVWLTRDASLVQLVCAANVIPFVRPLHF
jgi:hypothetical protein